VQGWNPQQILRAVTLFAFEEVFGQPTEVFSEVQVPFYNLEVVVEQVFSYKLINLIYMNADHNLFSLSSRVLSKSSAMKLLCSG
jgi:hypothetical protein